MKNLSRKAFLENSGFAIGAFLLSELFQRAQLLPSASALAEDRISARWSRTLLHNITEFDTTPLKLTRGKIPEGLQGTLYRNGPGRLERNGERLSHWFDGDGAVLAVNFARGSASAKYKYIRTKGMLEEEKAGRFLYPGLGYLPDAPFWKRSAVNIKNTANTSVISLPGKILALWEGGRPYSLNPDTLETRGEDDLGFLGEREPFCAHPKKDPETGLIYAFGASYGQKNQILLYEMSEQGTLLRRSSIALPLASIVHDFTLCEQYLVLAVPPVVTEFFSALLGISTTQQCLKWKPELGTTYLVVDKATLSEVCRVTGDPLFMWHFAPGTVDSNGIIELNFFAYDSFENHFKWLSEVTSGQITTMGTLSYLTRVRLDPKAAKVLSTEKLSNRVCEFPSSDPRLTGNQTRFVYTSTFAQKDLLPQDGANAISCIDLRSGEDKILEYADMATSEPIFVPDESSVDDGFVLNMVNNLVSMKSFIHVYNSKRLTDGPVCELQMPNLIPPTFHGTWHPLKRS